MTSQDLVPDNLPYGERKATVARMQQAGVPMESGQTGGASSAPAPPAAQGGPAPSEIDALTMLQPTPQGQMPAVLSPRDQLLQVAEAAQSEVMTTILRRVASKL